MKNLIVIPARMNSSRFYGKPLENILNIPMIHHCFIRAEMSDAGDVFIATPDLEIQEYCIRHSIPVVMTSDDHERATERVAEAYSILCKDKNLNYDNIIMLQGDEPLVQIDQIKILSNAIKISSCGIVNLIEPIEISNFTNRDIVKVALSENKNILFYSRAPIPFESLSPLKQLGMIAFSSDKIKKFVNLDPTPLEILESIDMLRFIENDISIEGIISRDISIGVDRPKDLAIVEELMRKDILYKEYSIDINLDRS